MEQLPVPLKGSGDIAKLTTGIFTAAIAVWFPPAAMAAPLMNYLIDRCIQPAQKILLDKISSGNIEVLSEQQLAEYVPMAYRFFEAAKEGEYQHNLEILASYITNELKQDLPDAANFSRMARRLESLSKTELQVIALINSSSAVIARGDTRGSMQAPRPFVSASILVNDQNNKNNIDRFQLQESLSELASRGLLIPDGASRWSKAEEQYYVSKAFLDLVNRAKEAIEKA